MNYFILFILAISSARWLNQEIYQFPIRVNKQSYQDYASLIKPTISLDNFIKESTLQPYKISFHLYFYIFYLSTSLILYTVNTLAFNHFILYIITIYLLFFLSILDYCYYLTDIRYITIILGLSLIENLFFVPYSIGNNLFSLFFILLLFSIISLLSQWIYKKMVIGTGDIILLLALSLFFNSSQILILLFLSSLSGIIFLKGYQIIKKQKLVRLPFIPFISFSALLLFIDKII